MKQVLCLTLALILLIPCAYAETLEEVLDKLPTERLIDIRNYVNELISSRLQQEPPSYPFFITCGEIDDEGFGQVITINEKTSMEESYFGYFLPPGVYSVCNLIGKYAVQISVYKNKIVKSERYEEFEMSNQRPVVLKQGESAEITISENEFIELNGSGNTMRFEYIKGEE